MLEHFNLAIVLYRQHIYIYFNRTSWTCTFLCRKCENRTSKCKFIVTLNGKERSGEDETGPVAQSDVQASLVSALTVSLFKSSTLHSFHREHHCTLLRVFALLFFLSFSQHYSVNINVFTSSQCKETLQTSHGFCYFCTPEVTHSYGVIMVWRQNGKKAFWDEYARIRFHTDCWPPRFYTHLLPDLRLATLLGYVLEMP